MRFSPFSSRPTPGPIAEVALSVNDIHVGYGQREILRGVSLDVHRGEVLAIIGPNGAGKSTLLAVMTGDLTPTRGTVHLDGVPLGQWDSIERAMRRSVLLQKVDVSFPFTVREVIEMGRAPWARTDQSARDKDIIEASARLTHTSSLFERTYTSLSGGERSRAAFARVLAQSAPVMLLDEPTAAMDVRHQELVMDRARQYARSGGAVVVVVHALDVAGAYADRIALLSDGLIHSLGAPADVLTSQSLSEVYRYPIDVFPHPSTGALVVMPDRSLAHSWKDES